MMPWKKNAQLWKRILNEGIAEATLADGAAPEVIQRIIQAPIITDNRSDDGREIDFSAFKGLAAPFPLFWIEGCWPGRKGHSLWGALVESYAHEDGAEFDAMFVGAVPSARPYAIGRLEFHLNKQGDYQPQDSASVIPNRMIDEIGKEKAKYWIHQLSGLMLDSLLMMACNNVSLEARESEPEQVKRATKKHGVNSFGYRYHVLVVRPPGSRGEGKGQEIGDMPRHLCRGHRARYGPKYGRGLLFGKYEGVFYIPPTIKGDPKNGTVVKDYAIPVGA
jgi:hypothetical protein